MTAIAASDGAFTVIALTGDIDLHVAPELMARARAAVEHGASRLVFDLSDATFIDSTTLGTLVSAYKRLRGTGGSIGVVCPDPMMARIFSITGLDRMFPVHNGLRAVLDAFGPSSPTGAVSRFASA